MARFRLVEIDEDGNVIKEHYKRTLPFSYVSR